METFFKGPRIPQKVQNKLRHDDRKAVESKLMEQARDRDGSCRFPLCGCRRHRFVLHVSHQKHRGMGGNPSFDRSDPALLMLLCAPRHRFNLFSVDKGNIEWRPLTDKGANGPVSWWADADCLRHYLGLDQWAGLCDETRMVQIAREVSPGVLVEPTPLQRATLLALAEMQL